MQLHFFVKNLYARSEAQKILQGVSLEMRGGEIHAIMGPNGSGKSTLAKVIMGHPGYKITRGTILFNKKSVARLSPEERARAGIFLAFQYPIEVPGVNMFSYLRAIYSTRFGKKKLVKKLAPGAVQKRGEDGGDVSVEEFQNIIAPILKKLQVKESFLERSVNEGFSGGEKKKIEMLQALVLPNKYAIFDEIDTGLDVDALRSVSRGIALLRKKGVGVIIITHYQRILRYVKPDVVHILIGGNIVDQGDAALAKKIERQGYETYK